MGPAPSAGPLTFDFAGQQQQACAWSVFEYDSVDGTGTNGSGAVAQQQTTSGSGTTLALTLGPLADAAASLVVGGILLGVNEAVTPGVGLAQIDLQPFVQGTTRGTLQTEDRTGGGSTVDWSLPATANAGAIALEIKAAPVIVPSGPATDAETLARQFEPVLFFSANERFFPADAKRYVERCALWRAQVPFDAKDSWGGKGGPFPRAPIIEYGKISALAGEPGTPLDSATLVDDQGEERFFDFKGWMDAARMPEPKVTATADHLPPHCRTSRRWRRSEAARQPVLVPRRAHRGGPATAPARDREGSGLGQGVRHPPECGAPQLLLLLSRARGVAIGLHEYRSSRIRLLRGPVGLPLAAARAR